MPEAVFKSAIFKTKQIDVALSFYGWNIRTGDYSVTVIV